MIGCIVILCMFIGQSYAQVKKNLSKKQEEQFVQNIGEIHSYGDYKWVTSFQSADGTIYLHGKKKSTDGGRTVVSHDELVFDEGTKIPEGAVFCRNGLFLALDGPTHYISPGVYRVRAWRSIDNLKTIKEEQAIVNMPEGPKREREKGEWFGLYFHRTILEIPDGTLLATMEGNFESDKIIPTDRQSKRETKYKQRSFVVSSDDKGKSWNYLSTIAYPEPEDPVGEGFDEPTMVQAFREHSQNRKRFLAIDYPLRELDPPEPNKFATTLWYSEDAFESPVRVGTAFFHIPAGKVKFGRLGLEGLYVHRGIFELDDGALLACCSRCHRFAGLPRGNFETDTIKPPPGADIGIQARCFLVKSVDGGRNWHYLSSIAVPNPDIIKTQEGYAEASLASTTDATS